MLKLVWLKLGLDGNATIPDVAEGIDSYLNIEELPDLADGIYATAGVLCAWTFQRST